MGNVNGGNVVRNGDWEHQICWTDPRQQQQPMRSNSESSSVQTLSDEQNSCYGSDEAYLTAGDDSCVQVRQETGEQLEQEILRSLTSAADQQCQRILNIDVANKDARNKNTISKLEVIT